MRTNKLIQLAGMVGIIAGIAWLFYVMQSATVTPGLFGSRSQRTAAYWLTGLGFVTWAGAGIYAWLKE